MGIMELVSGMWSRLGKGPGFLALAFFEALLGGLLAYWDKDLSGFALVLGAINTGVYGGGAIKAWGESRNGGVTSAPASK